MEQSKDWEDFLQLLNKVKIGEGEGAFTPMRLTRNNPKTWEVLMKRVNDLPGDDPITFHKERNNENDKRKN